jgi:hypothetical protein
MPKTEKWDVFYREGRYVEKDVLWWGTFYIYVRRYVLEDVLWRRMFCREGRFVGQRFLEGHFLKGRFLEVLYVAGRFVLAPATLLHIICDNVQLRPPSLESNTHVFYI